MNKGRFESFSDGVFAFAITLLILGILLRFVARIDRKTVAYNLMLRHVIASGAFDASLTPERIARTVVAYRIGLFTYIAASLLALVVPVLSFAAYVGITLYYYVPHGVDADVA